MIKWLIQPVKVEQEKIVELISLLEKADIPFDIVYPLEGKILNENKEEYVFQENMQYFVCGSYSLTRYVNEIMPSAVFSLEDYSFDKIWEVFGKENFINSDANIVSSEKINWDLQEEYFIRPLEDTKSFNGGIYNKNTFKYNGNVVVSSLKEISKEFRFFVVDGKIVTSSLYKVNGQLSESSLVDDDAVLFAEKMVKKFNHKGYVIDVAKINNEYKIMELNCLNASGFYKINLYKLIEAITDYYETKVMIKSPAIKI